jgi:hypothetical protein
VKFRRSDRDEAFDLISAELTTEMASFVDRSASIEQRATILIGAASVVGALQVDSIPSSWLVANLLLSFVAAICGVVVVFPRKGDALDVRKMRKGMSRMPLRAGREKLLDIKLEVLEADEKWLMTRGKWARAGFIALSLSIALALIGAVVPNDEPQPSESPSPPPSSTIVS